MAAKVDWAAFLEQESLNTQISKVDLEGEGDEVSLAETSLLKKIIRKGLVESKATLEIQRSDPNSPLYSIKSFEALNLQPDLLKGVYGMQFNLPSKIQSTALPLLLANPPKNLIAQSQSGTGKTAAFVLAMLSRVDVEKKYPQVLCLSPTYELAIQTGEVAAHMARYCHIDMKYATRGEMVPRGTKVTEHIIIGTPGKVWDWIQKFKVFDPTLINVFVLDEADVMIDTQGHQDQCLRIHKKLSEQCQMMLFSATYEENVMNFAEIIVKDPIIIRLRREEESLDNIQQYYVHCNNDDAKYKSLTNIYAFIGIGQAYIFCHTRKTASWLAAKMSKDGHAVALLSGDLEVEQRIAVLDRFRSGKEKVLISTNVLARGIDVEQVTIVVNFDLPKNANNEADCETYLHRIGRTGRFGKAGIAINLVTASAMPMLRVIEKHFNKKILLLDTEDSDAIERIGA